ncbi:MAG: hypothetical protein ACTSV2_01975 [Candidatus Thorarchaeota archaeon]
MKKINSLLLIVLLIGSVAFATGFNTAQAAGDPYVAVAWQVVDDFEEISHSEQNSEWMFGPQPTILIEDAETGIDIADNFYNVEVGAKLFINIDIPKTFLGENVGLDSVRFWGQAQNATTAVFILDYNVTANRWAAPITYHYAPGAEEPTFSNFLDADLGNASYTATTTHYQVVFAITFTEAVLQGVFWTGMQAIDELGRPVSPSWLSRLQSGDFITPPLALNTELNPHDFSLPQYFYGDIVDESGNLLHYATNNDTFIVRLLSNNGMGEVTLPFSSLTQDSEYKQWVNYTQPVGWPGDNMYNPAPPTVNVSQKIGPMLYFEKNATGTYALAGYPNLEFVWYELAPGTSAWMLNFTMIHNSTIPLEKYYVQDIGLTGEFDGGNGVRWGGYFTNETDMDPSYGTGAVINAGDMLWWTKVTDIEGNRLNPRPEIQIQQTMKLAYNYDFIEAFIFDVDGDIADTAYQGDELNFTFVIHKPADMFNGSIEITNDGNLFQVTELLANITMEFAGSGAGENETHYWQYAARYNITLDFENNISGVWSVYYKATYEKPSYTPVGDVEVIVGGLITVNDFDIDIGANESRLYVNASFDVDAPSMVLDEAKMVVGLVENIRLWNGTAWDIWVDEGHAAYPSLVDHYMPKDVSGDIIWSPSNLILGDVKIYVPQTWTVTDEGALDLDGNTYTTDDQYFLKRTSYWEDWGNITVEGMAVTVVFDPTAGDNGDEFWSQSWMGVFDMVLEFNANETFNWYKADDMSPVTSEEMSEIQDTLWADIDNDIPAPEYSYISWLSRNWTTDMTQIPGLEAGSWSNTWFSWGTQQTFAVAINETSAKLATFRAEYAGMLIFDDDPMGASPDAPDFTIEDGAVQTEEVTHVVLIDSVGSIEFRQPFGATNGSGVVYVDPETEIDFGVSIYDVDVTIYPLQIEHGDGIRGPWQFRQSYEGVIGLNSTNFDYWISHATIDEMSFDVSFSVDMVEYDAEDEETWNHAIQFKIDQVIGNWTLHDFDNSELSDRSLAVNYFAVLGTVSGTQYQAGSEPISDTNGDSTGADYYVFGSENSPYANVTMGGLPYTWGGTNHAIEYISGSSTAPIGAFSAMYQSTSGQSVTQWNVDATMLFMTAGYTNWGGHDVVVDPVFVSYTSAQPTGTETTPTETTPPDTTTLPPTTTTSDTEPATSPTALGNTSMLVLIGGGIAVVVVLLVLVRRRN